MRPVPAILNFGSFELRAPAVMGILNVTPDSFSDGGRFVGLDAARRQAAQMAADGAAIIDIGGESTRPGAGAVSVEEELERVVPVVEAVRCETDCVVSIDTSKAAVMRAAVDAGAALINDVMALQGDGALDAAAELGVPVCLMHMQGMPRTMQESPQYEDVVNDVIRFLKKRVQVAEKKGIVRSKLLLDPGFGFGKTAEHNVELLANLRQLTTLGLPILVGISRKSMLGMLTGRPLQERLPASLAAATIAVMNGASIVRAHDVGATRDALRVTQAVTEANE